MDKFENIKQTLEKDLNDDSKPWSKYLKLVEEKTGVQRIYIFFGEYTELIKWTRNDLYDGSET